MRALTRLQGAGQGYISPRIGHSGLSCPLVTRKFRDPTSEDEPSEHSLSETGNNCSSDPPGPLAAPNLLYCL